MFRTLIRLVFLLVKVWPFVSHVHSNCCATMHNPCISLENYINLVWFSLWFSFIALHFFFIKFQFSPFSWNSDRIWKVLTDCASVWFASNCFLKFMIKLFISALYLLLAAAPFLLAAVSRNETKVNRWSESGLWRYFDKIVELFFSKPFHFII